MKKIIALLTIIIICQLSVLNCFAQSPLAIPYQAVARNSNGNLIANQNVALRFSIHDVTTNGNVVYKETQSATTNSLGLFTVSIGLGTSVTGTLAGINWSNGAKFIQVELDASGGTTYINMGTTQLMSVPYALYANKSGDLPSGTAIGNTMHWNGTAWIADSALYNNGTKIGIGTTSPTEQLHTTAGVRHESLSGNGNRVVYADSTGKLTTTVIFNPLYTKSTTGAPIAIPDNSCNAPYGPISLTGLPTSIQSSSISVKVNITHTFDGDLRGYLFAPNGSILNLFYSNGGNGDNFTNTIFTDSAGLYLSFGLPPYTGSFKPEANMSTLCFLTPNVSSFSAMGVGTIDPNGTWFLRVFDSYGADVGTLDNWSISFNNGANPANAGINNLLPSQGGYSNGFLTTNGANPSWTTAVPVRYYMVVNGIFPSVPNGCAGECLGSIVMWPTSISFDGGTLKPCNGQLLPISGNTALFSILGTTYGGNGTSNFALPNLNGPGMTPVGKQ